MRQLSLLVVAGLLSACVVVESPSAPSDGGLPPDAGPCGHAGEACCGPSLCGLGLACESGLCTAQPVNDVGRSCSTGADCSSGVCLPLDGGPSVCASACTDDDGCIPGWSCRPLAGRTTNVCQCSPRSERCDGLDNDCNGRIDDGPGPNSGCSPGTTCQDGACTCTKSTCGTECVDLSSNKDHCGACGTACTGAQTCVGGHCTCGDGHAMCDGTCVDLATNGSNCGACGYLCTGFVSCREGRCLCLNGEQSCPTGCTNFNTDEANCGACGNVCPDRSSCTGGRCQCFDTSKTACGGTCVNLDTDSANCGACGNICPNGSSCTGGHCACPQGQSVCDQACVDLQTDSANCGSCDHACSGATACMHGQCSCPTGWGACGGSCLHLDSDLASCGACNHACPTPGAGTATCVAGQCGAAQTLTTGLRQANGLASDGTWLYWASGDGRYVLKMPVGGGATSTVGYVIADYVGSLFLRGSNLYSHGLQSWSSVPTSGSNTPLTPIVNATTATTVAEADATRIYWVTEDQILSRELPSGPAVTLARSQGETTAMAVTGTHLYWARGSHLTARGSVVRIPLAGGTPATIGSWSLSSDETVNGLVVDGAAVYVARSGGSSGILRLPLAGGTGLTLFRGAAPKVLVRDGTNLYWSSDAGVFRMPTGGGDPLTVTGGAAGFLALDANALYWTSTVDIRKVAPR